MEGLTFFLLDEFKVWRRGNNTSGSMSPSVQYSTSLRPLPLRYYFKTLHGVSGTAQRLFHDEQKESLASQLSQEMYTRVYDLVRLLWMLLTAFYLVVYVRIAIFSLRIASCLSFFISLSLLLASFPPLEE
jgi:hypothetical protein